MRLVGLTQRSIPPNRHGERWDALDGRWHQFLIDCELLGVALPNNADLALTLARSVPLTGIVLTGGEDLVTCGGPSPQRDNTERLLLRWAINQQVPVIGVCRGMQLIMSYFGTKLVQVDDHVATRHEILGGSIVGEVNSYHRWAAVEVLPPLTVIAKSGAIIEAVRHTSANVAGIMWHPERETEAKRQDIAIFRDIFFDAA